MRTIRRISAVALVLSGLSALPAWFVGYYLGHVDHTTGFALVWALSVLGVVVATGSVVGFIVVQRHGFIGELLATMAIGLGLGAFAIAMLSAFTNQGAVIGASVLSYSAGLITTSLVTVMLFGDDDWINKPDALTSLRRAS